MNTEIDDGCHRLSTNIIESKKITPAVACSLLFGFIKLSMMSAPFLSMTIMLLALWGVVGKATYTDVDAAEPGRASGANEAKNYLVNETNAIEHCGKELKNADLEPEGGNPMPERIDWEHAV